jgi:hypothetical protein
VLVLLVVVVLAFVVLGEMIQPRGKRATGDTR